MGTYQKFRGDPETKLFYLLSNFVGGINTEFSDDGSQDTDFTSMINFNMDRLGTLSKRNGFGELIAISEIFNKLDEDYLPNVKNRTESETNPETENDNIVYMKLLRNDNNCFRNLSGFSGINAYREYQRQYGFQNNKFTLLLITTKFVNGVENSSTGWYYHCTLPELEYDPITGEPTATETMTINCYKTTFPVIFSWDRNLMNMDSVEYFDKIWFTNNNKALVCFDRSANITSNASFANAFTYNGDISGITNNAYKPSGAELLVSGLGPNLLCTDPLHDIGLSDFGETTITTNSIQGAFFTTLDNKFISNGIIPGSEPLLLSVLYTGADNGFTITAKCGDDDIDFNCTVQSSLSTTNAKVYKIEFKNTPSGEVEFKIEKIGATLEPYYCYYTIGQLSGDLKPVTSLNIGQHNMCEMGGRTVYYKDDTIYFSDVNNMNYIPANNYIILPIEPIDKITKICYFKGVYIIFTKEKIFKMTGTWGTDSFTREYVNTSLGCHAGNTVVPIEDTLYFASPRGIYALKSSTYVESMQNIKELDLKVKKLTSDYTLYDEELSVPSIRFNGISNRAYAFRYKDKYMLFYNNYNDKGDYAARNDLDVLVYQYELGSYTTYRFKEKPTFLFMVDDAIETFSTIVKDQEYGDDDTQIEYNFTTGSGKTITDLSGKGNDGTLSVGASMNTPISVGFSNGNFGKSNGTNADLTGGFSVVLDIKPTVQKNMTLFSLQTNKLACNPYPISFEATDLMPLVNKTYKVDFVVNSRVGEPVATVDYKVTFIRKTEEDRTATVRFILNNPSKTFVDITKNIDFGNNTEIVGLEGTFNIIIGNDTFYNEKWNLTLDYTSQKSPYRNTVDSIGPFNYNNGGYFRDSGTSYHKIALEATENNTLLLRIDGEYGEDFFETGTIFDVNERHAYKLEFIRNYPDYTIVIYKDNNWFMRLSNISEDYVGKINRDLFVLGNSNNDGIFGNDTFEGEIYSAYLSTPRGNAFKYGFNEVSGLTSEDLSGNYHNLTFISTPQRSAISGIAFDGSEGYVTLPTIHNSVKFTNGFRFEFEGSFLNITSAKIFDIATEYNNDNKANKNASINCSISEGKITFNTSSLDYKTSSLSYLIDLRENHKYVFDCKYATNNTYVLSLYVDNSEVANLTTTFVGSISNINRFSNFIGKSNTTTDNCLKGILKNFKLVTYVGDEPTYRHALFEFDTSSTDFGRPMYVELTTKAINMKYPQHMKKLKHIFVKAIGGNNYEEFFFELYADGHRVNDPRTFYTYLDENGTVVYDYTGDKLLSLEEVKSLLGNIRLGVTKFGEGEYQTRKLVIPKKAKNFSCHIYGETDDYLSFESFGFVCKLGKVKEG